MEKRRIITAYGLSTEENIFIKECFAPDKYEYRDYSEHCETDLIAHSSTVLILNSQKHSEDGRAMIWDYYREAGDTTDEVIIWLGEPISSNYHCKSFKCFESFDKLRDDLKIILTQKCLNDPTL